MQVRAVAKNTGISAKKIRPIINMIRGRKVTEAMNLLEFTLSPSAKVVARVIRSASANAENNFQMDPASLKVLRITADDAPMVKRFQPRARGRADRILKRSSHISVVVSDEEA